jgi:hypothetical protein
MPDQVLAGIHKIVIRIGNLFGARKAEKATIIFHYSIAIAQCQAGCADQQVILYFIAYRFG